MKFDALIIGGGLSGLACGIYLAKRGKRCAIVSSGQSALHFSSGSFDLLNTLPDGREVENPLEVWEALAGQAPRHPYVKMGRAKMEELAGMVPAFLEEAGVSVQGEVQRNHRRFTPLGELKPTWLTLEGYAVSREADRLPWRKAALFNIAGFLDFYTGFIVDGLGKWGVECTTHLFNMGALEHLRRNPSEMRSANIARVFAVQENLEELGRVLQHNAGDAEVILLPAVLGLGRAAHGLAYLRETTGKEVLVLPTLPPSVPGLNAQLQLRRYFQSLGGTYMLGDNVLRADIEGDRVARVYSYNHGNIPFVADAVVLATGSYFSQGLVATSDRIYEPVFGLDVDYPEEREKWLDLRFFAPQAYQSFGVRTDDCFRGMKDGRPFSNLYAAGAVLGGFNALKEGCGGGVSLLTALDVARQIMDQC